MRILIVEDDAKIADFVKQGLQQAGFAVDVASDGEEGLVLLSTQPYDASIVDVMLPRLDGLSMIERLRVEGNQVPVIVLSARRSLDDRVKGLQAGGDDYLVKPFAFVELLERLRAIIRRNTGASQSNRLIAGELEMDLLKRSVTRSGTLIQLLPREFSLLEYLMRNAGHVVSKTMIIQHVWDYNFDPQTNVVEANICRLRAKINKDFERRLIRTVRGVGYSLEDGD